MKTKPIAECPFCNSNNTMVEDDVQFNGNIFFVRRCWKCRERFVEYNTIIQNMPWSTMEEFEAGPEQMFTEHVKRRMEGIAHENHGD